MIDKLKDEFETAVMIITHDLGVVAEYCDNIQVMYAGRIVESGNTDDIYYQPHHPYTWGLLQSIPRLDETEDRLTPIKGLPPSLINLPKGCSFAPRCPHRFERCDGRSRRSFPPTAITRTHASSRLTRRTRWSASSWR